MILQKKIQVIGGVCDCLDPVLGTGHRGYPQDAPYSLPEWHHHRHVGISTKTLIQ